MDQAVARADPVDLAAHPLEVPAARVDQADRLPEVPVDEVALDRLRPHSRRNRSACFGLGWTKARNSNAFERRTAVTAETISAAPRWFRLSRG